MPVMSRLVYNDGGRKAAGFKGTTGDCVTRAIAIAAEIDYREVYDEINRRCEEDQWTKGGHRNYARTGVTKRIWMPYIKDLGFEWIPIMKVGVGTVVHLKADELPAGRIIVRCSKHLVAVIDGVIHDMHDPSRGGTRAVYGYFRRSES